uniref:Uncharacterized protein n=1 Tax=Arundo donax TaxID=35708 RepID=A0A0A9FB99_ARUDO
MQLCMSRMCVHPKSIINM